MIEINDNGYINASKLCIAHNERFVHYQKAKATTTFLHALATELDASFDELIIPGTLGRGKVQGTFVHPAIAIHLMGWLDPTLNARLLVGLSRVVSAEEVKRIVEPPILIHAY